MIEKVFGKRTSWDTYLAVFLALAVLFILISKLMIEFVNLLPAPPVR